MKELGVFKQMAQLAYLPIYHKLLSGAIELDVFSKLTTPKAAEDLAEQEGWNTFGILLLGPAVATHRFFHTLNSIETELNRRI